MKIIKFDGYNVLLINDTFAISRRCNYRKIRNVWEELDCFGCITSPGYCEECYRFISKNYKVIDSIKLNCNKSEIRKITIMLNEKKEPCKNTFENYRLKIDLSIVFNDSNIKTKLNKWIIPGLTGVIAKKAYDSDITYEVLYGLNAYSSTIKDVDLKCCEVYVWIEKEKTIENLHFFIDDRMGYTLKQFLTPPSLLERSTIN